MEAIETTASREPIYQYRFQSDDEWTGWFDCNEKQYEEVVRYGYERRIIKVEPAPQAQCSDERPCTPCYTGNGNCVAQPESVELSDAQVDRILSAIIPGGSHARDWFLPHEQPKGLANVRDVVRKMIQEFQRAESAKQSASRQIVTATLPGSSRPTHRSIPPDDEQSAHVAEKISDELKQAALTTLNVAEKALYAWACKQDVGTEREYAFALYEIVRTAPREARQ